MVHRPGIDSSLCFVLLPLRAPFLGYYEQVLAPAAASVDLRVVHAQEIFGTAPIIQDIWKLIWTARVVIADVTGKNPNVNYELGICHALGVPTVLITKSMEDVPFDYRHRRCIIYDTDQAGWETRLQEQLSSTLRVVLTDAATGSPSLVRFSVTSTEAPMRCMTERKPIRVGLSNRSST